MQAVSPMLLPVEEELSVYALALVEHRAEALADWTARFLSEVSLVRTHLAPIRNRALLASSFGRESFGRPDVLTLELAVDRLRTSAVHVAYATRWLELADRDWSPAH